MAFGENVVGGLGIACRELELPHEHRTPGPPDRVAEVPQDVPPGVVARPSLLESALVRLQHAANAEGDPLQTLRARFAGSRKVVVAAP